MAIYGYMYVYITVHTKSQLMGWLNLLHSSTLLSAVTAKERVVIIPYQSEEGIGGYGRKTSRNGSFKTRVENATRKANKRSMIRV